MRGLVNAATTVASCHHRDLQCFRMQGNAKHGQDPWVSLSQFQAALRSRQGPPCHRAGRSACPSCPNHLEGPPRQSPDDPAATLPQTAWRVQLRDAMPKHGTTERQGPEPARLQPAAEGLAPCQEGDGQVAPRLAHAASVVQISHLAKRVPPAPLPRRVTCRRGMMGTLRP